MKLLRFSLLMFLVSSFCLAQNTITPTGVVQDSDAQAWVNGTWSWSLYNPNGGGHAVYKDGTNVPHQVSGSLDVNGAFSGGSIPNNAQILPTGTQANLTICSVTSAPNACQTLRLPITRNSPTLGSVVSTLILAPRVEAAKSNYAYNTTEILNPVSGTGYINTVTNSCFLYQNNAYVSCGGASSGTVNAAPQFRLFMQPNPGTQAVASAANTSQNAVTPLLQSVGNTDLYATGAGNNGIANFFTTFSQGVATVPPTSTDTESFTTSIPEQSILEDYRKNQITRTFHSPGQNNVTGSPQCGSTNFVQGGTGICNVYIFDLPNSNFAGQVQTNNVVSPGFNFGSPATTSANGWTTYFTDLNTDFFNTRGIKEDFTANINDNAVGDFAASAINVHTNGGATEPSSEGAELVSWHISENTSYFHGTCSSSCSTGSNLLVTTHTSGDNEFTDGSYLLDTTQSPLTTTVSSIAYPNGFMAYNFGTSVLTTSTAWGTITATTNPPNFQTPVSQTVTATLNVGGTNSPGPFVVGSNACLVGAPGGSGGFMEQAQITAVGTATTTQSVTFNSRYGYNAGSLLMQGSACGYYVTSNTSWQPAAMVIGAFSPTQAVIGACLGACTETTASSLTDMVKTEVGNVGATVNLYQGAEIIGTNKGTANNVQLATNTVPFAVNDVLIDPHPLAVLMSAGIIQVAQTTPINDRFGAMLELEWSGPAVGNNMYDASYDANINALYTGNTPNSSTYNYFLENSSAPLQAVIFLPGTTSYYLHLTDRNAIQSLANGGGYSFQDRSGNLLVPVIALNTPTPATATGQIPIVDTLSNLSQNYSPQTIKLDAHVDISGNWTNTGMNGAVVPLSLPIAGTNALGQIVAGSAGLRGRATLVGGTITVSDSAAAAGMPVQLTNCSPSGTAIGQPTLGTITVGTSFVINSISATNTLVTADTSSICWFVPN